MNRLASFFSSQSISRLAQIFIQNHKRFPLTLLSSLATTCLLIYFFIMQDKVSHIHNYDYKLLQEQQWFITQITMIVALGIPLFFSVEIASNQKKKWIYYGAITLFLVLYAWSNSWQKTEDMYFIARFFAFAIFGHLLVAFVPFLLPLNSKINVFWQYNKTLFIRILTAFLYTITLFLGLSLALFALEQLFGIELTTNKYMYLWLFLNIYCNTHFFVGGIPNPIEKLEKNDEYPIGLKYFAQYVLLTLVMIYMLILFLYEAKIIASWSLPRGWVSTLILACAGFGILAFLLLYPLRETNNWVKRYTKLFYVFLLPLVVLLFVAIYVRLKEYGVTEPRYFVVLLSVWLLAISLYFVISKTDNIKIIPISLAIIAFLSVVGPWGAFSVSDRSQYNRLKNVLEEGKFLQNGKIKIPKNTKLDSLQMKIIETSFDYFSRRPSLALLQPFFNEKLDSLKSLNSYTIKTKLLTYAGDLKVFDAYVDVRTEKSFTAKSSQLITVDGFSYMIQLQNDFYAESVGNDFRAFDGIGKVGINTNNELIIEENNTQSVLLDFNQILKKLDNDFSLNYNDEIENQKLFFDFDNKKWRGKAIIKYLNINNLDKNKPKILSIHYDILLSRK